MLERSSIFREMRSLFLAIGGIAALGASAVRADTPVDYLIQEVCVVNGQVTALDPLYCPGTTRKLMIGEKLPYHKYDEAEPSIYTQISDSFPIGDIYGRLRVVQTMFFTLDSAIPLFDASAFRHIDPNNPSSATIGMASYDLAIADGNYTSIAGSYDTGGGWKPFWSNASCGLGDSWIIAPKTYTIPFGQGNNTSSINFLSPQCPTNNSFSDTLTIWNFYQGLGYHSGKFLDTIKSWHFAGNSVDSGSIEVFYYTKQYGKTRWEQWATTPDPSTSSHILTKCGVTRGLDDQVQFGSTVYYLNFCHDWSFISPAAEGGWDPAINWHVDPLFNSVNLLQNTHMQCTNSSGSSGLCGTTYTCRTTAPWQRYGNIHWELNQTGFTAQPSANCDLKIAIDAAPNGQSVYQDVYVNSTSYPSSEFTFGVALWAQQPASATIAVFELSSSGALIDSHTINVSLTSHRKFFSGSFVKSPATAALRFQIYPETVYNVYQMTDAWIAPSVQ